MEGINPELAFYAITNDCSRTNPVLPPISGVITGTVYLNIRIFFYVHFIPCLWQQDRNLLHVLTSRHLGHSFRLKVEVWCKALLN